MLNEFYSKYIKSKDQSIHIKDFDFKENKNTLKPFNSTHINDFDKHFKKGAAFDHISNVRVFQNYDTRKDDKLDLPKKPTSHNPFAMYFKDLQPEKQELSNYHRYNVEGLGSDFNVAMDRAEIDVKMNEGILEDDTKLGKTLGGSEAFMKLYTELPVPRWVPGYDKM